MQHSDTYNPKPSLNITSTATGIIRSLSLCSLPLRFPRTDFSRLSYNSVHNIKVFLVLLK